MGLSNLVLNEIWMIELIKIIFQIKKGKFIDVGANVGQTLLKLKAVSKETRYIGFEPNPACIYYLNKVVNLNNFTKVDIIPIGISTNPEIKSLNFYSGSNVDSSATLISNFRENKIFHTEFVPLYDVKTVKNILNLSSISILKIDVEGFELEVLESFTNEIQESKPFILVEILPVYDSDSNTDRYLRQNKIETLLLELNYSIFRILKNKGHLSDFKKINSIGIHSNLDECDYILVPNEELGRFYNVIENYSIANHIK